MLRVDNRTGEAPLLLPDLFVLGALLPLAYRIHAQFFPAGLPLSRYWLPLLVTLLAWLVSSRFLGVYQGGTRPLSAEITRALKALASTALSLLVLVFLVKYQEISRVVTVVYFGLAALALTVLRLGTRALRWAPREPRYYALVGTGQQVADILTETSSHPEWGLKLAGCIVEDGAEPDPDFVVLGRLSEIGRVLETHVLDEVVFAVPRERLASMEAAILTCEEEGVSVRIALDVLRMGPARMTLADLGGLPMLTLSRTPTDGLALAVKRVFDVLVSASALLLLSPLLVGVAVAIKAESSGPVFFRQRRVGLRGRLFDILKFRSMHVDAEARQAELLARNEMSGPVFKITNDPRVTRVGRFIRRTSIDELPQFLNVLLGEMSVVGPRPPIPAEVAQYQRWHRRRLSVRPGITCIWQISGRNQIDFDRWMELDLEYIDHWSLANDMRIFFKTIPAVLGARGAN
ncbi:MAG: sugar transferase [Anaeromyxobacter sp.]|nr:sugar transferase [Anaeromyxobacter sp.]